MHPVMAPYGTRLPLSHGWAEIQSFTVLFPGQPGESTGHHSRALALLDIVDNYYRQL